MYEYVGPVDIRAASVRAGGEGTEIRSSSEHVACAGGGAVLSAGEMSLAREDDRWVVGEVSNQSTGYCPDVSSWQWVAAALERAGVDRAGVVRLRGFTHEVVFRRCVGEGGGTDPDCREVNVVREDDFFCVFCGGALPAEWNVGVGVQAGT
ncbi:hypothetical protein [Streptomyces liangshanensis]|uniref:hypothetical protein n=1 Tax=Streptomyces liangshanensis TaxID=2717324 RepID=UPI003C7A8475